jgi:hypothetical protein
VPAAGFPVGPAVRGPRLNLASWAAIDEGSPRAALAAGSPRPPDGGMTALDPRLSLAPGMIRGRPLAPRAAAFRRASRKPAPRLSTTGSTASSTTSSTATGRRPLFRGETACLSRLRSGAKLSPRLAPTLPGLLQAHPIEGQETGREGLLPLIERTFARI